MPVNIQLSWHNARKCWKKYYRGRHFYIGKTQCKGRSDLDGYRIALDQWNALKRELDRLHDERQRIYGGQEYQRKLLREAEQRDSKPALPENAVLLTDWEKVGAKPSTSALNRIPLTGTKIRPLFEEFLKLKRIDMDAGKIAAKMYIQYRDKLEDFVAWTEHPEIAVRDATGITASLLADYRSRQLELLSIATKDAKRGHGPHTVKKRLHAVTQFVRWLYKMEVLPTLPRNLDREFAWVPTPPPNPKFFTVAEVRKLFEAASRRTKLYVALALNCGYRQTDIATLQREDVDWERGLIDRERHKTKERQVHKLWAVTRQLLALEMTDAKTGPMLLSEEGTELFRHWIDDEGKYKFVDVIRLAFDRAMKSSGMDTDETKDKRRFETFRDTGANMIEREFQEYPHLSSQYLAHKEGAMKGRYVERHFDLLFKALDKLEAIFDLKLATPAPTTEIRPTDAPTDAAT